MEQKKAYQTKISSNEIELVDFRINEQTNGEVKIILVLNRAACL